VADEVPQPDAPTVPPAPGEPTPRPQYEFTEAENEVFESLSANLRACGWSVVVLLAVFHGGLLARWLIGGHAMYERFRFIQVWAPLVLLFFAVGLIGAGRAFGRVATTQGSDITHLMTGLRGLDETLGFMPFTWLLIVAAILSGGVAAYLHAIGL
jgi:hypothetical protein